MALKQINRVQGLDKSSHFTYDQLHANTAIYPCLQYDTVPAAVKRSSKQAAVFTLSSYTVQMYYVQYNMHLAVYREHCTYLQCSSLSPGGTRSWVPMQLLVSVLLFVTVGFFPLSFPISALEVCCSDCLALQFRKNWLLSVKWGILTRCGWFFQMIMQAAQSGSEEAVSKKRSWEAALDQYEGCGDVAERWGTYILSTSGHRWTWVLAGILLTALLPVLVHLYFWFWWQIGWAFPYFLPTLPILLHSCFINPECTAMDGKHVFFGLFSKCSPQDACLCLHHTHLIFILMEVCAWLGSIKQKSRRILGSKERKRQGEYCYEQRFAMAKVEAYVSLSEVLSCWLGTMSMHCL